MSLGLTLSYDDLGVRAAMDRVADVAAGGRAAKRQLMSQIGGVVEASTLERFELGSDPDGNPWVPSYRARLKGGLTLVDKGRLRQSIHAEVDAAGEAVEIGTADRRAAAHQFGATITAKGSGGLSFRLADGGFRRARQVTLPARPFIGLSAGDRLEIRAITTRAVAGALDGGAA